MTQFIQLHLLTFYPPSNLNRDDLGRPKTAVVGGTTRLRISSQSLKRAWRTSELFRKALDGHLGIRTKAIGLEVFKDLVAKEVSEENAKLWAQKIAGVFGKLKKGSRNNPLQDLEIEQLAHISHEERAAIDTLVEKIAKGQEGPSDADLELLKEGRAVDIAMFGRMLADKPKFNVEAAVQVSHAFSVHEVAVEDDFFTAVDDLNKGEEDMGAAHMGETEFSSGLFYVYVCINRDLLLKNLGENEDLVKKSLHALLGAAARVSPTGKQASFASRAYASYILAEKGSQQPRSLALAFLNGANGRNMPHDPISALQANRSNMEKVYGPCADAFHSLNVETGEGSLAAILDFVAG